MTTIQKRFAWLLSCLCLLAVISRLIWKGIAIDENTIFLFIVGALPWLTLFFKKIEIPGGWSAEVHDRSQSATSNPLPPTVTSANLTVPISGDGNKILSTLWRYQLQHFGGDMTKRWTFAIHPSATQYPDFVSGLGDLLKRGLVVVNPVNNQVLLTNEGITFVQSHPELAQADFYIF